MLTSASSSVGTTYEKGRATAAPSISTLTTRRGGSAAPGPTAQGLATTECITRDTKAMLIRPIRPIECAEASRLLVSAYGEGAEADDAYLARVGDVASRISAPQTHVLVATEVGGTLLGCVTHVLGPDSPWAEFTVADDRMHAAGFRMLGVAPTATRRGVATHLVTACINEAQRAGKRRVIAHSTPLMSAAHSLYGALGFTRRPDRDFSPAPGIDRLAFGLDI